MSEQFSKYTFEKLAWLEHDIWANWMKYLFTKGTLNEDGSFTIEPASVKRWTRQMNTDYDNLPEKEKESDRNLVKRFLRMLCLIELENK